MIFRQFSQFSHLQYGFSNRADGSMHRHLERQNRERYFRMIGIEPERVVTADLVHGAAVVGVSDIDAGAMVAKTDGLASSTKNLFLSATAADCFLVYFYESKKNAIAIAHAGWRGLLAGVVENTVMELTNNFGARAGDLLVCVSPGIRKCHFEISLDDKARFKGYSNFVSKRGDRIFVDLSAIIKMKLLHAGVAAEHIDDCELCTYCNERDYFSYRRDKPQDVQVQVGYIGLK